jgi:hypothetical protein
VNTPTWTWDLRDATGARVPSGAYLLVAGTADRSHSVRVVVE